MKVYLAARYSRRDELREYKTALEAIGVEITSRWLNETEPLDSQMVEHSEAFYVETATIDFQDVDAADALVFFSENPLVGWPRGGRHVEYGYAFKGNKPIYVVGPKENVFHYIGMVKHFATFEELVAHLKTVGV